MNGPMLRRSVCHAFCAPLLAGAATLAAGCGGSGGASDAPAALDAPAAIDTPDPIDAPAALDAPVPVDAPAAIDAPVFADTPGRLDAPVDAPGCVPPPMDSMAYFAVNQPCASAADCPADYACQIGFDADGLASSTCQILCEPGVCICASGYDCFETPGPMGAWTSCLPL